MSIEIADIRIAEAIARIPAKLDKLRLADPEFRVYGVSKHKYQLKPCATESEVLAFEKHYKVTLPTEYRMFLLQLGRGGAGPGNGLPEFEVLPENNMWHYEWLSCIAKPFKISTQLTNEVLNRPKGKRFVEGVEYDDQGYLELADHGCGGCSFLVITGAQHGTMWDRGDSADLFPLANVQGKQLNFLEWYEDWLDYPSGWVPGAYQIKTG